MTSYIQKHCGNVDVIVGLEARGFVFGPMIAQKLRTAFVPIRKKGKLPGETSSVTYKLEYGEVSFVSISWSTVKPTTDINFNEASGGYMIFLMGVGGQLPKTYYFAILLPKTARKWKNLDPRTAHPLHHPPPPRISQWKLIMKEELVSFQGSGVWGDL